MRRTKMVGLAKKTARHFKNPAILIYPQKTAKHIKKSCHWFQSPPAKKTAIIQVNKTMNSQVVGAIRNSFS
jgi:hypothetical protein